MSPSSSEKQRKFMRSDLGRLREGKKTVTGMSESQLSDYASKPIEKSTKTSWKNAKIKMQPGEFGESTFRPKFSTLPPSEKERHHFEIDKIVSQRLHKNPKYQSLMKVERQHQKDRPGILGSHSKEYDQSIDMYTKKFEQEHKKRFSDWTGDERDKDIFSQKSLSNRIDNFIEKGKRPYVGHKSDHTREVFYHHETPTQQSHGDKYKYTIGPFQTRGGADVMAQHGLNNPHLQTVSDAKKNSVKYRKSELQSAQASQDRPKIKTIQKQSIWATDKQGNLLGRKHGRELSRAEVEFRNKIDTRGMIDPRNLKGPSSADMRSAPVSKSEQLKKSVRPSFEHPEYGEMKNSGYYSKDPNNAKRYANLLRSTGIKTHIQNVEGMNTVFVKAHPLSGTSYRGPIEAGIKLRDIGAKRVKSIPVSEFHPNHVNVYKHPSGTFTVVDNGKKSKILHYPMSKSEDIIKDLEKGFKPNFARITGEEGLEVQSKEENEKWHKEHDYPDEPRVDWSKTKQVGHYVPKVEDTSKKDVKKSITDFIEKKHGYITPEKGTPVERQIEGEKPIEREKTNWREFTGGRAETRPGSPTPKGAKIRVGSKGGTSRHTGEPWGFITHHVRKEIDDFIKKNENKLTQNQVERIAQRDYTKAENKKKSPTKKQQVQIIRRNERNIRDTRRDKLVRPEYPKRYTGPDLETELIKRGQLHSRI